MSMPDPSLSPLLAVRAAHSTVRGVSLAYASCGEGAPVLLLHGLASDHRAWLPHLGVLGRRYRAMALTQRYFGTDAWADDGASYGMQTHVDDAAAFIAHLGLGPVHLVGWSYGGAVALAVAIRHPECVASLCTYDMALATFITDEADAREAANDRTQMVGPSVAAAKAGDIAGAVPLLLDGACAQPGAFLALPLPVQAMMRDNARALALQFGASSPPPPLSAAELAGLRCPAVFAIGGQTRRFYRLASQTAARLVPGGRCIEIDAARHLWPVQEPQGFCDMLSDVIDSVPAPG